MALILLSESMYYYKKERKNTPNESKSDQSSGLYCLVKGPSQRICSVKFIIIIINNLICMTMTSSNMFLF